MQPVLATTCPRGSGEDPKNVTAEPALLSGNLSGLGTSAPSSQSRSKCGSQVSSIFSLSLPLCVTWSQFNKGSVAPDRSSLSTHGLRLSSAVTSPSCVCLSPAPSFPILQVYPVSGILLHTATWRDVGNMMPRESQIQKTMYLCESVCVKFLEKTSIEKERSMVA